MQIVQLDEDKGKLVVRGTFDHPYPATKIAWAPRATAASKDLLVTTGDYLRIWNVGTDGDVRAEAMLNNVRARRQGCTHGSTHRYTAQEGKDACAFTPFDTILHPAPHLCVQNKSSEFCAPLTSLDWNTVDQTLVGTCSVDTTCTIWDLATRKCRTQLIAHDKDVYDFAWADSKDIFATVGADGSLRVFDLRSLEHSSIMYESDNGSPLLRLAWNMLDNNFIATFNMDSNVTVIIDVRMPAVPVAQLSAHTAAVNGVAWAPHSSCHMCTVGDDHQALIWDVSGMPRPVEDPVLAYTADGEVNQLVWSSSLQDWVAITFNNKMQMLRV
ncbi:WD40 repeat domain-containing protein [archaeon]|nr:MAG: WD40 repeat domain-containing protein [archaeon]